MKLKELDPNVPYEKMMIENTERLRKGPVGYVEELRGIIREVHESACKKIGIPVDTKMDCNLFFATTEDGICFFTRGDLLIYPGLKLGEYLEELG